MRKKLVNHFPFPFNSDKNSCFLYNELIGWINCCYKSREAIHFHLMSISQQFVEFSSWETLPCCRAPDPVWLATVFVSPWLETCCATDVVFWEDLLPCVSVTVGEKIHKAGKEVGLWQVEESVKDVKALGIISLDELVWVPLTDLRTS